MVTVRQAVWQVSPTLTVERQASGKLAIERKGGGLVMVLPDEVVDLAAALMAAATSAALAEGGELHGDRG